MQNILAGLSRKNPQLQLHVDQLFLDKKNPRLPESVQDGSEKELLRTLFLDFNLDELAESMAQNGYFNAEPLVAIPQVLPSELKDVPVDSSVFLEYIQPKDRLFTVVEGNRRLATVKLLLSSSFRETLHIRKWPTLSPEFKDDISTLPVIIYKERNDVTPYLGVRHIIGIQRWGSYAKARYIATMVQEEHLEISQVAIQIGDKSGDVLKNYICYKILEQAQIEFELDTKYARDKFSLLLLATGQGSIKRFIGLPIKLIEANLDAPVPTEKINNLKDLLLWIYGDERVTPVIKDSRQITSQLNYVVASAESIEYLKTTGNLEAAYERSDGEEELFLKQLRRANTQLENALGVAHRYKTKQALLLVKQCEQNVDALLSTIGNPND